MQASGFFSSDVLPVPSFHLILFDPLADHALACSRSVEGAEYIPRDRIGPVPVNYFVPLVFSQQAEFFHFRATRRPLFFFGVNLENWVEQVN